MKKIRLVGAGMVIVALAAVAPVHAENCRSTSVEKLKKHCFEILRDAARTLDAGLQLDQRALDDAQEAARVYSTEGLKAIKTAADIALKCRPVSAGCLNAVRKIPEHVRELARARDLYLKAVDSWRQAGTLYGAAEVAFSDQGGDEIAAALRKCGKRSCFEFAGAVEDFARAAARRSARNQAKALEAANTVGQLVDALEECEDRPETCEAPELTGPIEFEEPIDKNAPEVPIE